MTWIQLSAKEISILLTAIDAITASMIVDVSPGQPPPVEIDEMKALRKKLSPS